MHCVRSVWGTYAYGLRWNDVLPPSVEEPAVASGEQLISTLKRDLLLFESVFVAPPELETVSTKVGPEARDELAMLKDQGLIRTYDRWFEEPEVVGELVVDRPTSLQSTTVELWDVFRVMQGHLWRMAFEIGPPDDFSDESRRICTAMDSMGLEKAREAYFDFGALVHDFQSRFHAEYLQKHEALDVVPVLDKEAPVANHSGLSVNFDAPDDAKSNVVNIGLEMLPFPDESISWAELLEYRSDPDVRRNYLAFRGWLRRAAEHPEDVNALRDELEHLILERESHLRTRKLKINTSALETVLTIGAEIVEDLAKLKVSSAIKALFTLKHRKVALFEAEREAPGRDIAYISGVRQLLASRHR